MKWFIAAGIALLLIVFVAVVSIGPAAEPTPSNGEETSKTYSSSQYGIAFEYPSAYFVTEHDAPGRHSIVLIEDTPGNRALVSGEGPPGEAPPAITIDIFPGAGDAGAEAWVRTAQESNFQLSPGNLVTGSIGGQNAVSYSWSGLYEGDTTVAAAEGTVYMFSGTYLAPGDQIRSDYRSVLSSVRFTQ